MKSITIHNMDTDLSRTIQNRSKKEGVSMNKLIKRLLREALGLIPDRQGTDISMIQGSMTSQEADQLLKDIDDWNEIDMGTSNDS